MNIHEILSMKIFTIILGHLQGILPYNSLVSVGRETALEIADTQKCLDTFICPKREKKKKKKTFFSFAVMKCYEDHQHKFC